MRDQGGQGDQRGQVFTLTFPPPKLLLAIIPSNKKEDEKAKGKP